MEFTSIAEQLLFTTVRIESFYNEDGTGEIGIGTGFLFEVEKRGHKLPFLITNKHVIESASFLKVGFHKERSGKPLLGSCLWYVMKDIDKLWIGHPDANIDITVTCLLPFFNEVKSRSESIYLKTIPASLVPEDDILEELDAIEEVVFIGYPEGIYDEANFLPVFRKGITASSVKIDFQGEPKFLIDAHIFPGSSGSPVYLYSIGSRIRRDGVIELAGVHIHFLGVLSSVFLHTERGRIFVETIPTNISGEFLTSQMIGLGIVFKAKAIMETIQFTIEILGIG